MFFYSLSVARLQVPDPQVKALIALGKNCHKATSGHHDHLGFHDLTQHFLDILQVLSIASPSMELLNQDLIRVHVLADDSRHDALRDWIARENSFTYFHVDIAVAQILRLEDNRSTEQPPHTVEPRLPVVISLLREVEPSNVVVGAESESLVLSHACFLHIFLFVILYAFGRYYHITCTIMR